MEKRYQVFVSSTYEDLREARQQVIQALLELDCFPAGMELFPAADDDQWTLIKRVIDECDYYIVVLAGRYGSVGDDGMSYTEKEYRYALDNNKPILGFVRADRSQIPAGDTEDDEDKKKRLNEFYTLVKRKTCKKWTIAADLGGSVTQSIIKAIKNQPATGWIRSDELDSSHTKELLQFRKRIDELENELSRSAHEPPPGTDELAQGDSTFEVRAIATIKEEESWEKVDVRSVAPTSWNDVFSTLGPILMDEAPESDMLDTLAAAIVPAVRDMKESLCKAAKKPGGRIVAVKVERDNFGTILIQLRALGLVTLSKRKRAIKDNETYWTLTPYGDTVLTRLRAIPRHAADGSSAVVAGSPK